MSCQSVHAYKESHSIDSHSWLREPLISLQCAAYIIYQYQRMGRGGHLLITNATSKTLTLESQYQYQMVDWNPPSRIPPKSQQKFYIEFSEAIGHNVSDDEGKAVYKIGDDTTQTFLLHASWSPKIKAHWETTVLRHYFVVPPPNGGEKTSDLGWRHNGDVFLTIADN